MYVVTVGGCDPRQDILEPTMHVLGGRPAMLNMMNSPKRKPFCWRFEIGSVHMVK